MGVKAQQNVSEVSRAEVGEIDTRAPFESVKAAVNLFGEGVFSPEKPTVRKPKSHPSETIFTKETRLHLAQKELNKFKDQLKNGEATRIQALAELEKAKRTVDDLTQKLNTANESRKSALEATETAAVQSKQLEEVSSSSQVESNGPWKQELQSARELFAVAISELDAAKQDLRKIREDFKASMDAKVAAVQQEEEAKQLSDASSEQANQLSKDIAAVQESLLQVTTASVQTREEELRILAEKEARRQSYKLAMEETEKKLASLKKEVDPVFSANLETKLAETTTEIGFVQKEMEKARVSDLDSITTVTTELDGAKGVLQKVAEEESSLRSLLESLSLELQSIKKGHLELKEKEAEAESLAGHLQIQLQTSKAELEAATKGESNARAACDDMMSTLQQLYLEAENAREDAETVKRNAEDLRKEAEEAQIALDETEKRLHVAFSETEEAKAAEANALNQIKLLSEKANMARTSTSESGANITISAEEFEALSLKVGESETLAEMKVAAAMAQVDAVRASENEATKKLEASHKEIEEIKLATEGALKSAEMAEAARRAVEGEMRRWREREQKKAAEAACLMLSETEMPKVVSPPKATAPKQNLVKTKGMGEKPQTVKKTLMPSLSGIFIGKKNQAEGGSPS